ncbi:MAG: hypothetical protein ABSH38_00690 [Verrucomicrobiota bacterium]|jgi:hypothetical protein
MSVTGKVKNGVVVLPPGTKFPEGAEVRIETGEPAPQDDPFLAAALKAAKPRPHWPKDYALNHGHYISGEPKKS